jgi:hypothetical protein
MRRPVTAALAVLFVSGVIGPPPPAIAAGRALYVATWGSDAATGTAWAPWRSLFWAVRRARPGDTITVRGGIYREAIGYGALPGRRDAPIRLQAARGERVVLMGTIQLEGADFWTVKGINVTYWPEQGRRQFLVKFDGGIGWSFLDAEVWGSRGVSNLMVIGSAAHGPATYYRIAGNCIHDNDATGEPFMNDHNLYLMPGYRSGPGMIERNIFFNAPNGAHIKAAGNTSATGAANVTIRYNTMASGAAGVIVGYGTHHLTLWKNLIGRQVGGSASYNAAVLGNHVSGTSNVAAHTAVWGYPKSVRSTWDSPRPVASRDTVWLNPAMDSISRCTGFHPTVGTAKAYGRYAP